MPVTSWLLALVVKVPLPGIILAAAVKALTMKETFALDGKVGGAVGCGDRALGEIRRDLRDLHAEPLLRRVDAAVACGGRGADALGLQELVGEKHVGSLEADGVRVGQVVAYDVDLRVRGIQASQGRAHGGCQTHVSLSLSFIKPLSSE